MKRLIYRNVELDKPYIRVKKLENNYYILRKVL
jgi:hypothetical protein